MILGLLSGKNVHQQSLSRYVDSPNPHSALRKVERFFVKKPCVQGIMRRLLLIFLDLKESLTFVSIEPTGSSALKISITSF
ncbi:MAG: hypothetical protein ACD_16C00059G0021 [uncultured bacterium]|nr:MAG: hypothetical protein ACD_16C00059G0021 [uncultured bacterium]OFW69737.1 MAG: hypothetical protein A2X70_01610 [Alphaproteobacteria bacterium GWC2_42_16]OFW74319.1 MAG: hypothetical protein A2Z80_04390 [Alphaproteobacteria bacterium GWA2_41_27]OFW84546.1 MAG: hypothetical protein A3E50_07855 [Alphaproteobacteria bacterium RIFCSPHIGHO2_12_FULL_42_100]OFW85523.1 MAG: hypothetical protein A2W06_02065 [Alphaproteobacteria bacterium RBG_16_42_14]OFW91376.1 MAG: hypothetical protein A2W46_028